MFQIFYVLLIAVHVKCQTSSETSENEIFTELSSNDGPPLTSIDIDEKTNINNGVTDESTTVLYSSTESTSEYYRNITEDIITTTESDIPSTPNVDPISLVSTTLEPESSTTETTIIPSDFYSSTPQITPNTDTEPPVEITTLITSNASPNITIALPTFEPSSVTDRTTAATSILCRENEVYSCLPFCLRTCNNPMSKLICWPVPSYIRLCRKGCTCKKGYLLEKTIGKCVNECPAKQPIE